MFFQPLFVPWPDKIIHRPAINGLRVFVGPLRFIAARLYNGDVVPQQAVARALGAFLATATRFLLHAYTHVTAVPLGRT